MESESGNVTYSTNISYQKNTIILIAIIVFVAISIIAGVLIFSAFISNPEGQDTWLFKSAYETLEG